MVKKNTWVQIEKVLLQPNQRNVNIPIETKNTSLIMWVKGYLQEDANIGDIVTIKTKTNRIESGKLIQENPSFKHNFGNFCPELNEIDKIVLKELYGDDYA